MKVRWFESKYHVKGPCPRCNGTHDGIEFRKLTNPLTNLNYWAMCPEMGEPFLVEVREEQRRFQWVARSLPRFPGTGD